MALAAEHICLSTSSRRRMQRMMLPEPDTQTHSVYCEDSLFKYTTIAQINWHLNIINSCDGWRKSLE